MATDYKSPLKSVGVMAGVVGAANGLNLLLPFLGMPALPIGEVMTAVLGFASGMAAIWGRWRAGSKIKF